jgi:low temperature requirement protein LtrA
VTEPRRLAILRAGDGQVTNIELFFDLVYVFAVTQLSHLLVAHTTVDGALRVAILLGLIWHAWIYTTWMTTFLDPSHTSVRVVLLVIMLGSLVLAAELPRAFGDAGLVVAGTFVAMQVGRALFTAFVLRGHELRLTFQRITVWSSLSGVVMILGALAHGHAREALWAAAICIDLGAAAIGFWVPGLGRATTSDWTISGAHFAERCQAFVLIALGESIVVTGATFSDLGSPTRAELAAFVVAFASSVGLWWIYFDRAAEDSSRAIAESDDPGRLGRSAFHWVHPLIVLGIIIAAAADEVVLADPHARSSTTTIWLVLGGVALYLFGHALFKAIVWRVTSWSRLGGVIALALLFPLAAHVSRLALATLALLVIVGVAAADRRGPHPVSSPLPDGS